jgi:tetratricopeptide (TPR) repeat protein
MICPVCKTNNIEQAKFCHECGTVLKKEYENYQKAIHAATILENEGEIEEALQEFLKADKIKKTPEICLHISNLFYRLGKLDEAIERYNLCLEEKPNQTGAHYGLGLALYRKAQISEAIQQFKRTILIDPDFLTGYFYLGVCYYHHGQLKEACDTLGTLIEKNPEFTIAYYHLGESYAQLGDIDKTISNFEKVVERNNMDAPAFFQLGLAYYKKGEIDKSIDNFKKVLELDPEHERARLNLKALEEVRTQFY